MIKQFFTNLSIRHSANPEGIGSGEGQTFLIPTWHGGVWMGGEKIWIVDPENASVSFTLRELEDSNTWSCFTKGDVLMLSTMVCKSCCLVAYFCSIMLSFELNT